jgi:hypothetical protein
MNNVLKMLFLEEHLGGPLRKILTFIDNDSARKFTEMIGTEDV